MRVASLVANAFRTSLPFPVNATPSAAGKVSRPKGFWRLEVLRGERSCDDPFVKADILSLPSRTSVRSLGWPRLVALSQPIILGTCHVLDEAGAPEALGGPILINRHHSDRLKTFMAKHIPAVVPVDLRLVSLRGAFGIREPYDGVAFRLPGNRGCQSIHLFRCGHERQGKCHLFGFLQIANDFDTFQSSEFAFKTAR